MLGLGLGLGLTDVGRRAAGGGVVRPMNVVVSAGQSNAVGSANTYDGLGGYPANVYQYDQSGALAAPTIPLDHYVVGANNVGAMSSMVQFAREYMSANPDVDLVILPCGDGGTGFSDNRWNPGDDLYNATVARINAFAAAYPNAEWKSVFWNQGEREAASGWTEAQYASALDAMIAAMRSDSPAVAGVPFVAQVIGSTTTQYTTYAQIRAAIRDLPNRVVNAYWTSELGTLKTVDTPDNVHYGPRGSRMIGLRQFHILSGVGVDNGGFTIADLKGAANFDPINWWQDSVEWTIGPDTFSFQGSGTSRLYSTFSTMFENGVDYTVTVNVSNYAHSVPGTTNTLMISAIQWDNEKDETSLINFNVNTAGEHSVTFTGTGKPGFVRLMGRGRGGELSMTISSVSLATA